MKKLLSIFILMLLPMLASADENGKCGENLTWTYVDATNTLTIEGTGEMTNYTSYSHSPFYSYRSKILKIIIGDGVTSIGDYAFCNCSSLTSITIPNRVTSIGVNAFGGCSSLTSIIVMSGNTVFDSRDNCNAIIETASNTLVLGCKSAIIPNSVTSIGDNAFYGCDSLTSIAIPNSVKIIGDYAFYQCYRLTSITIPNSVTSIGEHAFGYCNMRNITIPNSVTSIGESAFYYCSSLTSVTIPNSVTRIEDGTFYKCYSLDSPTIPNSVTYIGKDAFGDCITLTSITIPNSVNVIDQNAFENCYRLNTIYCLNPKPPYCANTKTFLCDNTVRDKYDVYTYATLHVPMGSKEVYSSAYEWRYFNKIKEDMEQNGQIYYANLTVKQGTTGYTRQAVKAAETYTIFIGSLGNNKVNAITFNGVDVTDQVVNGYYTTPEIKGESELSISFETETNVRSMTLNDVKVTGYNGEININYIDEPSDVSVYTVDGKLVGSIPSVLNSATIQVPKEQLYIVKVGSRTYKLAL